MWVCGLLLRRCAKLAGKTAPSGDDLLRDPTQLRALCSAWCLHEICLRHLPLDHRALAFPAESGSPKTDPALSAFLDAFAQLVATRVRPLGADAASLESHDSLSMLDVLDGRLLCAVAAALGAGGAAGAVGELAAHLCAVKISGGSRDGLARVRAELSPAAAAELQELWAALEVLSTDLAIPPRPEAAPPPAAAAAVAETEVLTPVVVEVLPVTGNAFVDQFLGEKQAADGSGVEERLARIEADQGCFGTKFKWNT